MLPLFIEVKPVKCVMMHMCFGVSMFRLNWIYELFRMCGLFIFFFLIIALMTWITAKEYLCQR